MTGRFGVRDTELSGHAGTVESIGDRVGVAQRAGAAVRAGGGAYGQLCAMVPGMLGVLQSVLVDGIGRAAGSLHDTGAHLRAAAADYAAADERAATALHRIGADE